MRFQITAFDKAVNNVTIAGEESYYSYQVVPEFPNSMLLLLCGFLITLAAAVASRKLCNRSRASAR